MLDAGYTELTGYTQVAGMDVGRKVTCQHVVDICSSRFLTSFNQGNTQARV
jgi:hypothetical protein